MTLRALAGGITAAVLGLAVMPADAQTRNVWEVTQGGSYLRAAIVAESLGDSDFRGVILSFGCHQSSGVLAMNIVTPAGGSGSAKLTVHSDTGAFIRTRKARHEGGMVHLTDRTEIRQIAKVIGEANRQITVNVDGRVARLPIRGAKSSIDQAFGACPRDTALASAPVPTDLRLPADLRVAQTPVVVNRPKKENAGPITIDPGPRAPGGRVQSGAGGGSGGGYDPTGG